MNDFDQTDPITGQIFHLDVDGDGKVSAFGDGLIIIDKIFGSAFEGDTLTDGAIDSGEKITIQQIHKFIQAGIDSEDLDVDKNGEATALGDGLMVIRHLFGFAFSGDALIKKVISPDSPYFGKDGAALMAAQNIDVLNTLI